MTAAIRRLDGSRAARGRKGHAFVVSSPSGGGKTTVVERLLERLPGLVRSVSVTTRAPRAGEQPGRDYHFIAPSAFARMRRDGQLLEWATVHGASYGTPKAPVLHALADGRNVVLSIDVQGARQVRRLLGRRAILVFLLPPSLLALRRRLQRRRTESPGAMQRRLAVAKREMGCASWYDAVVVNDQLEQAVRQMASIVRAARQRKRRRGHGPGTD